MNTISTDEVRAIAENESQTAIINVLPGKYHQKEHIPGSINIPEEEEDFVDQVESFVESKDSKVVVYCASETCDLSPKAAKKLEQAGFTNVFDFEGGMEAWKDAGFAVESAA